MKEKICKKLKELYTLPLRRADWSGERGFVRRYKQGLALAWIVYFLLREELVKEILRPVSSYLMDFSCIQWFYVNRLTILIVSTFLLILAKIIFSILRRCYFIRYSLLDEDAYPEYDFPFQEDLVSFLNRKEERGRNIFWLNGAWGSGKTHFIRTFFDNQLYKSREIYYISCFGIRTREQAEKVLIDEIEQHSTFGSLDHIPVVSSLVKWSYKILGLDLMKKHSLVIFDDLERVTYSEKKGDSQKEYTDSPEDYNDLLGFIDHLANHRNQKVLVLMNKEDMGNTYQKIIEGKFKPVVQTVESPSVIISKLCEKNLDMATIRKEEGGESYFAIINILLNHTFNTGRKNFRTIERILHKIRIGFTINDLEKQLSKDIRRLLWDNDLELRYSLQEKIKSSGFEGLGNNHNLEFFLDIISKLEDDSAVRNVYLTIIMIIQFSNEKIYLGERVAEMSLEEALLTLKNRDNDLKIKESELFSQINVDNVQFEVLIDGDPEAIRFNKSMLFYMLRYLHPQFEINKRSLKEYFIDSLLFEFPQEEDYLEYYYSSQFKQIFTSYQSNDFDTNEEFKYFDAWKDVIVELKERIEDNKKYFNYFTSKELDIRSIMSVTRDEKERDKLRYLNNMPRGVFPEYDAYQDWIDDQKASQV
ncbi:P-loop NTPase fold protein [Streptococcus suis]|uniref:KAP_NTPase n=2 Tax=Streptococcus suis TaxID=1307 RepID=A0A0Z8MET1_STRSU|nr:P-loop NTPase fold protein [Streptococcus suis]CYU11981.1 KAP_NTPase [Streptococcus suis]CYU62383.1 KAP_NTPase [Streptococcus suis]CYW03619.1 KAP_NTPase [Streptococcus suis]CYW07653.1 KAP_NTPase [Streptococcus suis]